nr:UDP-N-acetylmuramyl-tripeptide synthetase [Clostridia bacterium]
MLLQYLIENLTTNEVIGTTNVEIGKVEYDSKKIEKKDVFVAVKGYEKDGNDYIDEAIGNGAICVIVENDIDTSKYLDKGITIIKVENSRIALAVVASTYYDNPSSKLKMIGITGTKGKTTTAYMIRDIMNASGKKTGMIGTIYNTYGNKQIEATRTSPESLDLQKLLRDMVDSGMEYVVMEVSSHALSLDRVYGIHFFVSVFTNLSEDHLDFHKTMDSYLMAKKKLFDISDLAIVNGDDIYAPKLIKMLTCKHATFGLDNQVNLTATDLRINADYVEFKMYVNKMLETIHVNIPGKYTIYNSLAAIAVCSLFNCQMDAILLALANVKVPGRSEIVPINKTFTVM